MQINDYIEALPTHRDENYLYTDARDAMEPVEDVVNASIDATGIGGSVVGKVLNVADCGAVESAIAQELVNLNTVVISDVLGIEFNEENPTPVEVMLSSEGGKSVLAQSRVDIVATENSKSQMIVRTNGLKSAANCVMSIDVKANATLDVVFVQTEKSDAPVFVSTTANVAEGAKLSISTININPGFVRNNVQVNLKGEHSHVALNGVYEADGGHVDNTTLVNHLVPNCTSEELYKGVLNGDAKGAFAGRIVVAPDAQKTSAQQTNRNMLLSTDAHAYAKPQLEIYADDVKCSHGATSGQIDQTQLFYMQQRGIDKQTAMRLLTSAFALEVVNKIPVESVRNEIASLANIE